jgi:hypothetical protein
LRERHAQLAKGSLEFGEVWAGRQGLCPFVKRGIAQRQRVGGSGHELVEQQHLGRAGRVGVGRRSADAGERSPRRCGERLFGQSAQQQMARLQQASGLGGSDDHPTHAVAVCRRGRLGGDAGEQVEKFGERQLRLVPVDGGVDAAGSTQAANEDRPVGRDVGLGRPQNAESVGEQTERGNPAFDVGSRGEQIEVRGEIGQRAAGQGGVGRERVGGSFGVAGPVVKLGEQRPATTGELSVAHADFDRAARVAHVSGRG